ncbi:hypothetical protein AG0111_0g11804 [Alternaria gaisen]|uniref:Uncharacterized protein n=1 Tax=Alternaria gaisen TaxID=167740 RepID=A0ACB6F667_9PLEO|nr:hypothetical protein AG0111_0g11804 [Alternaria gaisen]
MGPKRVRVATQPFEQGVNPGEPRPSKKRKQSSGYTAPIQATPRKSARRTGSVSAGGLASPPPTLPRNQSPLFEPEPPHTQPAVAIQAEDIIDGEDDGLEEEEEEDEEDGGNGGVEEEQELPNLPSSPIPIVSPFVHVRWRACFGDMEKNAITTAYNVARDKKFDDLFEFELWDWVDRVVDDLKPRKVKKPTLCAVVYPARQLKRDRAIKALRRGDLEDWYALKELVKAIDEAANEYIHVDFDLMLAEELNEAPRAAIIGASARARPVTATMIQEDGIAGVLAAERAGGGHAIGLRDRWRSTYDDPTDDVKLAILRQKDRADHEKNRRKRSNRGGNNSGSSGDEDIKSLTKLLIVGQLNQMNREPLREIQPQARNTNLSPQASPSASAWVPIEYEHIKEILEHTENFWSSMRREYPHWDAEFEDLYETVVTKGNLNINMLFREGIGDSWTRDLALGPGWLLYITDYALKWQKSYTGLQDYQIRRVERAKKRDKKVQARNQRQPTSSVVGSDDE